MVLFTSQDQEELVLLQDFVSILRPGGIIREQLDQAIQFLKALNTEPDMQVTSAQSRNEFSVSPTSPCPKKKHVRFANADSKSEPSENPVAKKIMLDYGFTPYLELSVPSGKTWSGLKADIERKFKISEGEEIEVLTLSSIGLDVRNFELGSVISNEALQNGDVVKVHFTRTKLQSVNNDANYVDKPLTMNRIACSKVSVRSRFQFLALSLHSLMLDQAFFAIVDVVELPDLMQRPWRRLPEDLFVRDNWHRTPGTIRMLYKHDCDMATSRTSLLMIAVRSALVGTLSLSDKDGGNEFAQIELSVDRYVREWALGAYELLHADELHSLIRSHLHQIMPVHFTADSATVRLLYVPSTGPTRRKVTALPSPPRLRNELHGAQYKQPTVGQETKQEAKQEAKQVAETPDFAARSATPKKTPDLVHHPLSAVATVASPVSVAVAVGCSPAVTKTASTPPTSAVLPSAIARAAPTTTAAAAASVLSPLSPLDHAPSHSRLSSCWYSECHNQEPSPSQQMRIHSQSVMQSTEDDALDEIVIEESLPSLEVASDDSFETVEKADWDEGLWYTDAEGNPLAPIREADTDGPSKVATDYYTGNPVVK